MTTISDVSICNRALDLLGADPITSLEDGSKAGNLCRRNFEAVRNQVLRAYPWNSAMRRASLPALSTAPAWGYARQFQLPEGPSPERCLRVYRLEGEIDGATLDWKVIGRTIQTDEAAPLNIEYIAEITDPAQFDPLLAEAIAGQLGVYLAANLTESGSRMEVAKDYLKEVLRQARETDAQEGSVETIDADLWLASRL